MMDLKLPHRQQQLYDALAGRGDVPWSDLCAALEIDTRGGHPAMWLSAYVRPLNKRLAARGLTVKPGDIKGTMRLTVV